MRRWPCKGQVWGGGVEDETWINSSINSCLHYFPTRNRETGIVQRHRHVKLPVCFYSGKVKMQFIS